MTISGIHATLSQVPAQIPPHNRGHRTSSIGSFAETAEINSTLWWDVAEFHSIHGCAGRLASGVAHGGRVQRRRRRWRLRRVLLGPAAQGSFGALPAILSRRIQGASGVCQEVDNLPSLALVRCSATDQQHNVCIPQAKTDYEKRPGVETDWTEPVHVEAKGTHLRVSTLPHTSWAEPAMNTAESMPCAASRAVG